MKKKRIYILAAVLALLLALTACSAGNAAAADGSAEAKDAAKDEADAFHTAHAAAVAGMDADPEQVAGKLIKLAGTAPDEQTRCTAMASLMNAAFAIYEKNGAEAFLGWDKLAETERLLAADPQLSADLAATRERAEADRAQAQRTAAFEEAEKLLAGGEPEAAFAALDTLPQDGETAAFRASLEEKRAAFIEEKRVFGRTGLAAGAWYTALAGDAVRFAGDARYESETMPGSADKVFGGLVGLVYVKDGVPAVRGDTFGEAGAIESYHDIVSAAVGVSHVLLLRENGEVVACGAVTEGRGEAAGWTGITAVAAGAFHSLGLKADGTVLFCGSNASGQGEVAEWTDIVSVSAGLFHSVGVKADGTVLACGDDSCGQCAVGGWTNVSYAVCGPYCTLGVTADGRLLYAGDTAYGLEAAEKLENVLAAAAGPFHIAALLEDGTVCTFGSNDNGQRETAEFRAFGSASPAARAESVPSGEYVYVGEPKNGPWFYVNKEGVVSVSGDNTLKVAANRADLYAAAGTVPVGLLSGGGDMPQGTMPGPKLARQNKAVFAISGDYFSYGYNADGIQIRRGIVRKDVRETEGFAFFPDGTMRLFDSKTSSAEELLSAGVQDSWVFGPALIENGVARDISGHPLSYNDVTLRCAVGHVCPYHHIAMTTGSGTLKQVTDLLLSYGCVTAYNLDGGRSVSMAFMGEAINRTLFTKAGTRNLQDMIGFLTSDSVPPLEGKYVNRRY